MTWDGQLYFPSKGSVRYGFLSPIKIHRPWQGWNPQQWVTSSNIIYHSDIVDVSTFVGYI
jgi:hypothetical protein